MLNVKRYRFLAWFLFIVLVVLPACGDEPEPSRWDAAQEASTGEQAASSTSDDALPGSTFNQFFPASGNGLEVVYTQEKQGFAEASLTKDGAEVATLSISDTVNNPDAVEKYKESDETLAGYPVVEIGDQGTGVLVADRFQVQVRSKADDFDQEDRHLWLSAFDLDGLKDAK